MNPYGYTLDFAHQCAAWTVNNQGPARKQCGLPVATNIGGWVYLCQRHYELVESEVERDLDTLNTERVKNLEARLSSVGRFTEAESLAEDRRASLLLAEYEDRRPVQTVYFIRCQQFVKIGISKNPDSRLRQIRGGGGSHFPRLLDVGASELIVTESGGRDRERELHAKFSHLRHTGEWFTEAPELTDYIESLGAAA